MLINKIAMDYDEFTGLWVYSYQQMLMLHFNICGFCNIVYNYVKLRVSVNKSPLL